MNPVMAWVNLDLAYMAMPPVGGVIDTDQDDEILVNHNIIDEGCDSKDEILDHEDA